MTNASEKALKLLFSCYDSLTNGNPWLLISMLRKSSSPNGKRQIWNKVILFKHTAQVVDIIAIWIESGIKY